MLRYSLHKLAPAASTATITPRCPRRFLWSPQFRARSLAVTRQAVMGDKIQLYSIATPNGQKVSTMRQYWLHWFVSVQSVSWLGI